MRLQLEQARRRLYAFCVAQVALTQQGWRIVHAEDEEQARQRRGELCVPFTVDGETISLVGRIDRIDFHEPSRIVRILDYKTADTALPPLKTHFANDTWIDLQLPLYRHLWPAAWVDGPADCTIELGYFNLPKTVDDTGVVVAPWDAAALDAADTVARSVIRNLINSVFGPAVYPPPEYSDDLAGICLDHVLGGPSCTDGDEGDLCVNDRPASHCVIRASAGSGKTHQLTNRYLKLLATGVEPDAILATTFTRKAAGEIIERVLHRLAKAAGDPTAAKELATQLELTPNSSDAEYFAKLLRAMLRSLHRARISTLDSFYIALAGSFSFELGMPAGWSICEDQDDELLRREALERILDQHPQDIERLFPLLSKGENKRSVHRELQDVIARHHEIFLGSELAAWNRLQIRRALRTRS